MDPQTILEDLLACTSDPSEPASDGGDLSEVESKTTYLHQWLDQRGYAPQVTSEQLTALRLLANEFEQVVGDNLFEEGQAPQEVSNQVRYLANRLETTP